ncbi:MAG: caspase family protein [Bacteroidetes bacterium]|nr:MAG: caspase family protein [Bacteroidota bacterium]
MMKQLVFLLAVLLCSPAWANKTFYGIIMADVEDPGIGMACEHDVQKMNREFKKFAEHNNAILSIETFTGKHFSEKKLLHYLEKLNPAEDDVVFFYYSGHGQYEEGLGKVLSINGVFLPLKTIEKILDEMPAGLKFIVTDCCSQRIPMGIAMQPNTNALENADGEFNARGVLIRQKNYQRLLDYEGMLVVESSQPGQFSYAFDKGGIFTEFFLKTIHDQVEIGEASWKNILDETRRKVENFVGENLEKNQIPVSDDTNLYQKVHAGHKPGIPAGKMYEPVKN